MNYGLQLYSVRDAASENYENTLKAVADMGYEFVESAGFFEYSADQIKQWLDKYNLKLSSTHSSFRELKQDFDAAVKFHKIIGDTKFIIPCMDCKTKESLDYYVELFNKYEPMLKEHGIDLGFHNHAAEFLKNQDGIIPMEYLLEKTNIKFEIDVYWAYVANRCPLEVLEQFKSRHIGYIHLKDGLKFPEAQGKSLGLGSAPVRDVIAKAKDMGLQMIVESEDLNPTGLQEVARCAEFLKANG